MQQVKHHPQATIRCAGFAAPPAAGLRLVTTVGGRAAGRGGAGAAPNLYLVGEPPVGAYHRIQPIHADSPELTERPRQLLQLLARQDLTLNQAAACLHISVSTANQHVAAAKRALGVRTLTAAVVTALRRGLIEL